MAKIAKKLTDLMGNTPLMELSRYSGKYGLEQNIIAKLEAFNPAGSVKAVSYTHLDVYKRQYIDCINKFKS